MNGAAAILQAAQDGDVPAVERPLSDDPRLVSASDDHLKTPLHWAAEHDRRDVAEMLLDAGADLEATTSWGATAKLIFLGRFARPRDDFTRHAHLRELPVQNVTRRAGFITMCGQLLSYAALRRLIHLFAA
jgi:hypothetical protein